MQIRWISQTVYFEQSSNDRSKLHSDKCREAQLVFSHVKNHGPPAPRSPKSQIVKSHFVAGLVADLSCLAFGRGPCSLERKGELSLSVIFWRINSRAYADPMLPQAQSNTTQKAALLQGERSLLFHFCASRRSSDFSTRPSAFRSFQAFYHRSSTSHLTRPTVPQSRSDEHRSISQTNSSSSVV